MIEEVISTDENMEFLIAMGPLVLIIAFLWWMSWAFDQLYPGRSIRMISTEETCKNCNINKALGDGFGLCGMCKEDPRWWIVG